MRIAVGNIQRDSGGICNNLGNDSMCDSKQESSYEHGSDFERLPRYGSTLQRIHKCIEVSGGIFENLL